MVTNETRMDTNEYSEMQELVGIRVPGEAGFGQFVVFVSPRISTNEARISTNKYCEVLSFEFPLTFALPSYPHPRPGR